MGARAPLPEPLQRTGETRRQQLIVSERSKHLVQLLRCHSRRPLRPRSTPPLDDAIAHPRTGLVDREQRVWFDAH